VFAPPPAIAPSVVVDVCGCGATERNVPSCAVYGGLQPFAASELIALHRNVLDPLNAGACGAMTGRCSSDGTRAHSLTHARAATDTSALPCHACDDAVLQRGAVSASA
jgi:hypothetical protein